MPTRKLTSKAITPSASTYVGRTGEIFFDTATATLKLSDGATAGGVAFGQSVGSVTLTNGAVIKDTAGDAVAFGQSAGLTSQGTNAVAIGKQAGETSQAANSIILNATGSALNQTTASTFTVKPVRDGGSAAGMAALGFKPTYYNPTTGEFVYANS